ncbi:alpha/beta hydrolase [Robiginitomaculum antarcticum]|uniref:alpha/beta hydrolase n=1 Tax=Robiginitomaculum antarcticum TaxID=437507 RepID=UPI0003702DCF|nr:alpha/beta hydrolase [Robiginitomaculum antarcticum]
MDNISLQSRADGLSLKGYHWPVDTPRAIVTIVHGLGEHSGRYEGYALAMTAEQIAVIAVDLRGHGQSAGSRGRAKDLSSLMSDIDTMCAKSRALYPNIPHFLMGHSMGGGLALRYAATHPDAGFSGIIASAPMIRPVDKVSGIQRILTKLIMKIKPGLTLDPGLDGSKISSIETEARRYLSDPLVHSKLGADLAIVMIENGEWLIENADLIKYPLLIAHSRGDQLTGFTASETFCDSVPDSEFIAYDDGQHEIHHDIHAGDVKKAVVDFVLQKAGRHYAAS